MNHLLVIQSSPRDDSVSTTLSNQLSERLKIQNAGLKITTRNIATSLTFVSSEMIAAFYTPEAQRNEAQKNLIALSDELLAELENSDGLVIAAPMWNFTMPAALKAWFDLVVRVGRSFQFKKDGSGFESLLKDRKTYLLVATGGVPIGSPMDMLTPIVKTILGFIGIKNVEIIAVEGTNMPNAAEKIEEISQKIKNLAA